MLRFLTLYHFEKMALWFLLFPIGAMLLTVPFIFFSDVRSPFLFTLLVAILFVIAMFLEQTIDYQTMLRTMPVTVNTIVRAKFLFCLLILIYHLILLAIATYQQATHDILPILTTAATIYTLAMNFMLLFHFYTRQQKNVTTIAIISYVPLQFAFPYIESFLFTAITMKTNGIVLLLMLVLTLTNKQLCLHFAKTKDHY